MIHARRGHPAFGLGSFLDLGGTNPSVLSYAREHEAGDDSDTIVCVNNLSRFAAAGRARPAALGGLRPRRAPGRRALPADRRAARIC